MACFSHAWKSTKVDEYNTDIAYYCRDCSAVKDVNGRVFYTDNDEKEDAKIEKRFLVGAVLAILGIPFIG